MSSMCLGITGKATIKSCYSVYLFLSPVSPLLFFPLLLSSPFLSSPGSIPSKSYRKTPIFIRFLLTCAVQLLACEKIYCVFSLDPFFFQNQEKKNQQVRIRNEPFSLPLSLFRSVPQFASTRSAHSSNFSSMFLSSSYVNSSFCIFD